MQIAPAILDSKVVLLTGAGASKALGKYTTREFLERFLGEPIARFEADHAVDGTFLRQELAVAWAANRDIEHVLDSLERRAIAADLLAGDEAFVATVLQGFRPNILGYYAARCAARDAVYDEVIRHYGQIDSSLAADLYRAMFTSWRACLDGLTGGAPTLPVFTLNYDVAIEAATSRLEVARIDGLIDISGATERRWSRAAFEERSEDVGSFTVTLVKLHGSVRWGRRRTYDPDFVGTEIVELPAGLERDPEPYEHAVLYPSLAPKPLNDEPFHSHYRIFNACLTKARLLVVIGCSMRDPEVQIAVRTAVEDNLGLRLLVVGPDAHHATTAQVLRVPEARIAAIQRPFEPEDTQYVQSGRSDVMGCIRGFLGSALGHGTDHLSFPFGATRDVWLLAPYSPDETAEWLSE